MLTLAGTFAFFLDSWGSAIKSYLRYPYDSEFSSRLAENLAMNHRGTSRPSYTIF